MVIISIRQPSRAVLWRCWCATPKRERQINSRRRPHELQQAPRLHQEQRSQAAFPDPPDRNPPRRTPAAEQCAIGPARPDRDCCPGTPAGRRVESGGFSNSFISASGGPNPWSRSCRGPWVDFCSRPLSLCRVLFLFYHFCCFRLLPTLLAFSTPQSATSRDRASLEILSTGSGQDTQRSWKKHTWPLQLYTRWSATVSFPNWAVALPPKFPLPTSLVPLVSTSSRSALRIFIRSALTRRIDQPIGNASTSSSLDFRDASSPVPGGWVPAPGRPRPSI
ncbi:uncharacterized protein B0T15DRAFT_305056 [Chaetomium strumarium]|uniref:Uncharacterized protein n=1 Tax=Chaetomium strumarium TaxID=1170767 RepID=A0AAJ0GM00_9PEZI|nr:hypothetical protein B0T15DRAFT_305056 [Chaetomium strumarium]